MSDVIASTYEILEKIGAGGGGNVFLANHLRLGKKVVLKADKRKITTRPDLLRREVDVLKNLSHPHIPQVYDFFIDQETVYTVMDYIEGESLDQPLKRGERFSQPQVIQWAIQLLEALSYLHSPTHGSPPRGFVHSDIKPANLMRTPYNEICLIDFNIALALGEENVVGCSAGYASPEHYGLDFSTVSGTATVDDSTKTLDAKTATVTLFNDEQDSSSATKKKSILPDVRSDIYSVGATLYHLLSGKRPAKDAKEVIPLSTNEFSPQIVAILSKAMNPNPDLRFQTADEMLDAFLRLRPNDPRTKRFKKVCATTGVFISLLFLFGASVTFIGLKRIQTVETWLKLVEYSKSALQEGNKELAIDDALQAIPQKDSVLTPPILASAQEGLTEALGIYNLSDGYQTFGTIEMSSEPFYVAISPAGTRLLSICGSEMAVYDALTLTKTDTLPTVNSSLVEAEYLDDNVILFAGAEGLTAYDLESKTVLWTGEPTTGITISEDGSRVAAVYRDDPMATIYDTASGQEMVTVDFDTSKQSVVVNDRAFNPEDNLFELNADGTRLAVSFSNGGLRIYDLQNRDNDIIIYEESDFTHFEGGFCGDHFAFSATGTNQSVFVILDVTIMQQTQGLSSTMPFHVQADEGGIYVSSENTLVQMDPESGEQQEVAYTDSDIEKFRKKGQYTIVSTSDKSVSFFGVKATCMATYTGEQMNSFIDLAGPVAVAGSPDTPILRVFRQKDFSKEQVFKYDSAYPHNEARLSADKTTVMLFRYDRFSLFDMAGNVIAEVAIPDADQVYDQQYRRCDGESWLEVQYNNGLVRNYSAEDGSLISEEEREPPERTLYEQFLTDKLRIEAPYHETATAYDRESGKLVAELEPEANLTYVTQVGEYIVTEYMTVDRERYGLLLNEKCEPVARLPNLCDVLDDGTLLFDDMLGNLRQSRIYSIDELVTFAKTKEAM